ncbi:hypothetical protein ACJMK2_003722 [Sinanodonta woodiana]|uniref:B box-type domain-containing protein n=1 Tax=Sinanodonta woodiana TaxID=1069815 RepID=A0ABD3Y270_SINWO
MHFVKCLQDYISTKIGTKEEAVKEFMCSVCRAVTCQPTTGISVEELASEFPRSANSVSAEVKVKVDRQCDACRYEGESKNADIFCVVCDEGLCGTCSKVHRKTKSTRDHKLISADELTATVENPLRFTEGFGCPEHQEKQIEYYCQLHDDGCCEDCFFINHRPCDNIKRLSIDLPFLLQELKPEDIKHLQTVLEKNEFNVYELEAEVNNLTAEILDTRQKINKELDELDALVEREGHRIYNIKKKEMIKRQEENHHCQDLIRTVRNSHAFLETILKYGTDIQKFLVCKKSLAQFKPYIDQIRENYEETESDFSSIIKLESIPLRMHFSYPAISSNPLCSSEPLAERQVNLEKVVEIQSVGKCEPMYSGIVYLPDGCVVLTDFMNKTCCLYDASYIFVSKHNDVAVTYSNKTAQLLSIRDRSINNTGTVTTKQRCGGVAAIGKYEILVSGPFDDLNKFYWSNVSRKKGETCFYAFDYLYTHVTRIALSRNNSRVYISGFGSGEQHFIYSSKNLKDSYGIAVDREDNVHIVGNRSQNIPKLSPDGTMIHIITAGAPHDPKKISFDKG